MDWENYTEIAEALHKLYPFANPVMMPHPELIEKVIALPGFTGGNQPLNDLYPSAILKKWIFTKNEPR
jgi:FeS assembly protein IscX